MNPFRFHRSWSGRRCWASGRGGQVMLCLLALLSIVAPSTQAQMRLPPLRCPASEVEAAADSLSADPRLWTGSPTLNLPSQEEPCGPQPRLAGSRSFVLPAEAPTSLRKHPWASAAGLAVVLGAGAYKYYRTPALQDNDHGFSEAWRLRFTRLDRHRLDDNDFQLNYRDHAVAGRAYYGVARAGNFSPRESLLATALGSSIWEYLVEVRELVSINDQVVTIVGGSVIGEALYQHQLSLLNRANLTPWQMAGSSLYGFPFALPKVLGRARRDGTLKPPSNEPTGELEGSVALLRSSFQVGNQAPVSQMRFEYRSEVRNLPGEEEAGRARGLAGNIPLTRLRVSLADQSSEFHAATIPFAWYTRNQRVDERGRLRGYQLAVGPLWDYRVESLRDDAFQDQWGTTALLGLTADLRARHGALALTWSTDLTADFTSIQAQVLDEYRKVHSLENTKTVLKKRGYYHALGGRGSTALALRAGPLAVEAEGSLLLARSLQGLDRWQSEETDDFVLNDTRRRWRVGASLQLPARTSLVVSTSRGWLGGEARGIESTTSVQEFSVGLRARF